ncbi:MAG: type II toxin-antitoxin system RelE/ParE family toxin [Euryarchaeota archaeon]|nr:type II toxin-antitoxin system RelE/ParE family toxin [Euryarchaeota archaeon]
MTHKVQIDKTALAFLEQLPEKNRRVVKEKLKILHDDPWPGKNGDKELLNLPDYNLYRIHIARSYTAFYLIDNNNTTVTILELMTIEKAHKKYGRL